MLLLVFSYPVNGNRFVIISHCILDIGDFCFLSFYVCCSCWKFINFVHFLKEPAFCFFNFLLFFCFLIYLFIYFSGRCLEICISNGLLSDADPASVGTMLFFFFFKQQLLFISLFLFIYLFMAVLGLHFCARAFSSCSKWGPLFIAVRGPLTIVASLVAEHRLQTRRLSNCGSRAQLLRGMWDLPRPGLEPVSPALAGRFSTTVPPGKPLIYLFLVFIISLFLLAFGLICSSFSSFLRLEFKLLISFLFSSVNI